MLLLDVSHDFLTNTYLISAMRPGKTVISFHAWVQNYVEIRQLSALVLHPTSQLRGM
jgi:hypothetical protein